MSAHPFIKLLPLLCLSVSLCLRGAISLAEDEPKKPTSKFDIHAISVWMTEPGSGVFNAQQQYQNTMPPVVDSQRPRKVERAENLGAPVNLITLWGEVKDPVDLTLRINNGRVLSHWPPAEAKNNRYRWLDLKPSADTETSPAFVSGEHWFHKGREMGTLALHQGSRMERFLMYDAEFTRAMPLRLEGGPDKYRVANSGKVALKEVLIIVPTPEGRRIGWASEVPPASPAPKEKEGEKKVADASGPKIEIAPEDAERVAKAPPAAAAPGVAVALVRALAKPVMPEPSTAPSSSSSTPKPAKADPGMVDGIAEVELSAPLDEAQFKVQVKDALKDRLTSAGLNEKEIELLFHIYAKQWFEPEEMIALCRLPDAILDEVATIDVEPEWAKVTRVGLVLCRNVDPQIREKIKQLIVDLGNENYAKREEAETKLRKLGKLAAPILKESANDSDPERAMRIERLLMQTTMVGQPGNKVNGFIVDQF